MVIAFSVNEIFDPARVSEFYSLPTESRQATLNRNKATNYSVVREELLNHLYEKQYHRRIHEPDEQSWHHQICGSRQLREARLDKDGKVELEFHDPQTGNRIVESGWDRVVAGTGYLRNAHERLLRPAGNLIQSAEDGSVMVSKNYRVPMKPGTVQDDSGVWLQGCCQESHGVGYNLHNATLQILMGSSSAIPCSPSSQREVESLLIRYSTKHPPLPMR